MATTARIPDELQEPCIAPSSVLHGRIDKHGNSRIDASGLSQLSARKMRRGHRSLSSTPRTPSGSCGGTTAGKGGKAGGRIGLALFCALS
jgi:hypothetical protein